MTLGWAAAVAAHALATAVYGFRGQWGLKCDCEGVTIEEMSPMEKD